MPQCAGFLKGDFWQLPPLLHCIGAVEEAPLPQLLLLMSPVLEELPLLTPVL
jgi:hypothetical protein